MPEPPYRRLASALRHRIATGALPAGARLPSTRVLAREHGVAAATAAHALRLLASDGLVKPVARIGNVVVGARPPAPPRTGELVRDELLRAGIAIADEEGLAAVSIRSVAAKVGVPPMSIYRHVGSKQQLVHFMADAAFGEERLPRPARTWRGELEQCARFEWRLFRRHPWLARALMVTRPTALPNTLALADRVLHALAQLGVAAAETLRIHIVLHNFVQGVAMNLEAEAEAVGETGMSDEQWMGSQTPAFAALAETLPAFGKLLTALGDGFELDFDDLFETGLRTLLDGLATRRPASPAAERGARGLLRSRR